jgi:hypothetical protein
VNWVDQTLDDVSQSAKDGAIGYMADGHAAAEPTALAALAFVAHARPDAARQAADALAATQQTSGEVAVRAGEQSPGWTTSLAVLAWSATDRTALADHIHRAIEWLLNNRGQAVPRSEMFGHNTELVGWAYAEQTHSWIQPTAFAVLALKAAGKASGPAARTPIDKGDPNEVTAPSAAREGIAVLIDRQLPGGGLNYGNTYVLGQLLRPHVEPTGIGLLALAGEPDASGATAKTVAWLRRSIGPETTPLSLGWALLGLRAHGAIPPQADQWLEGAAGRVQASDRSPHKLALLALAAKGWPT